MKFYDATNKSGLVDDIDFLVFTNTTSYPLKDKARNINTWYRKTVAMIWESSADWQFDDTNLTTLPIAVATLVDGQQDYALPSTAQKLERVEVKDSDGNYQVVRPMDKSQIKDTAMSEWWETDGMPIYYDLVGNSLMLYPAPSASQVTTTIGLKIYVARDIDEFTASDTSQEPGFANNFHRILSYGAALDYVVANGLGQDKVNTLATQIAILENGLKKFYSQRHTAVAKPPKIKAQNDSFI